MRSKYWNFDYYFLRDKLLYRQQRQRWRCNGAARCALHHVTSSDRRLSSRAIDSSVITRRLWLFCLMTRTFYVRFEECINSVLFFVWQVVYNYICVCVHFCNGNYITEKTELYKILHNWLSSFPSWTIRNARYKYKYTHTRKRCCLFLITQSKGSNRRSPLYI